MKLSGVWYPLISDIGRLWVERTDRPIRVTSFDVAEKAGVNQSTVSRALNDDPAIKDSTKAKVRTAAEALGYYVDTRASALRRDRTGTLAIVVM